MADSLAGALSMDLRTSFPQASALDACNASSDPLIHSKSNSGTPDVWLLCWAVVTGCAVI